MVSYVDPLLCCDCKLGFYTNIEDRFPLPAAEAGSVAHEQAPACPGHIAS